MSARSGKKASTGKVITQPLLPNDQRDMERYLNPQAEATVRLQYFVPRALKARFETFCTKAGRRTNKELQAAIEQYLERNGAAE